MQDATKAVDKLPNESQIGCYNINLLPLKATGERQIRSLHEELLNSLRRKVQLIARGSPPLSVHHFCRDSHVRSCASKAHTPIKLNLLVSLMGLLQIGLHDAIYKS